MPRIVSYLITEDGYAVGTSGARLKRNGVDLAKNTLPVDTDQITYNFMGNTAMSADEYKLAAARDRRAANNIKEVLSEVTGVDYDRVRPAQRGGLERPVDYVHPIGKSLDSLLRNTNKAYFKVIGAPIHTSRNVNNRIAYNNVYAKEIDAALKSAGDILQDEVLKNPRIKKRFRASGVPIYVLPDEPDTMKAYWGYNARRNRYKDLQLAAPNPYQGATIGESVAMGQRVWDMARALRPAPAAVPRPGVIRPLDPPVEPIPAGERRGRSVEKRPRAPAAKSLEKRPRSRAPAARKPIKSAGRSRSRSARLDLPLGDIPLGGRIEEIPILGGGPESVTNKFFRENPNPKESELKTFMRNNPAEMARLGRLPRDHPDRAIFLRRMTAMPRSRPARLDPLLVENIEWASARE